MDVIYYQAIVVWTKIACIGDTLVRYSFYSDLLTTQVSRDTNIVQENSLLSPLALD